MKESIYNQIKRAKKPRVYIEYESGELDDEIVNRLAKTQLLYSLLGLAAGVCVIILGCVLLYTGITGNSSFVANIAGLEAELTDAAPGTILIVVGLFVVVITKFKFTIKKKNKTANNAN